MNKINSNIKHHGVEARQIRNRAERPDQKSLQEKETDAAATCPEQSLRDDFHHFSLSCARIFGSAWAFVVGGVVIIVWGLTGPLFGFSDSWQLVINTGTTIVTFLMVFLIQNPQNRDARA